LVSHSKTALAKVLLVFFAVLFAAVLVHPDVDLLDVHDVKITSARSQLRLVDSAFVKHVPFLIAGSNLGFPEFSIVLSLAATPTSIGGQLCLSGLRI